MDDDDKTKLGKLLSKLFQFDTSILDFGIYRILNYKREQIKKFIDEELPKKIENAFQKHENEVLEELEQKFETAKKKIRETLGLDAFTMAGDLKEQYQKTPLGEEYLAVKAQKGEINKINEIKSQIFNDLYNFFSRYYEEGDFVPQPRYSIKGHKYAIPYNGEEVKLYWANSGQYYIKTGLLFRDYSFWADANKAYKVVFRTVSAKEEVSSKKATKERFFVLDNEKPVRLEGKIVTVCFQYRELTEAEVQNYQLGKGSYTAKQGQINQKSYELVLNKVDDLDLRKRLSQDNKDKRSLLLDQISVFTDKNTTDYFIHRDLKNFLLEQLDYFIKADVLTLETLEKEKFVDKHLIRMMVVKEIAENIIAFLAQIEEFQKKLWEKKKFVIKTEYVITTDRVPEKFYSEILKNDEQKEEWKGLGFEIPKTKQEIKDKKLPVDTKHFSDDFKLCLIEKLTENADLDDLLDGLLIKSENWSALNLLRDKYHESVKMTYIDPPYNTGSDGFLYKDQYQHSSWLTMLENRLILAKEAITLDGGIFVSIGNTSKTDTHITSESKLTMLMNALFGEDNYVATFIRKSGVAPRQDIKHIATAQDYVLCYAKKIADFKVNQKPATSERYDLEDEHCEERGKYQFNKLDRGSLNYSESLDYPIIAPDGSEIWPGGDKEDKRWIWRWSKEKVEWGVKNDFIVVKQNKKGKWVVYFKEYERVDNEGKLQERENPYNTLISEAYNEIGNAEIEALFGKRVFEYPKPVCLVEHLLKIGTLPRSLISDFFAGSGTTAHAVMKLNKEDGGHRKFVLVEMADYFDTVLIPRIKKVAYSFNWKEGKPQDKGGGGGFFKYQILEQYEDALDNIEFAPQRKLEALLGEDYLLKYFLDFETRGSNSLLNIEALEDPFNYRLKVNLSEAGETQEVVVDLLETFNYLLGLKVKKVKARVDNGRKYKFILGEKEGRNYVIVWREYNDSWTTNDFKKDEKFIVKEIEGWAPHIVYVNGQSSLTPKGWDVQCIEAEFKCLMEAKHED